MIKALSGLKKILIVRLSSMGDILLSTPLLRTFKNQNPATEIDFVVREEYFDLLKNNPHLSKVYKYSKQRSEKEKLIDKLKSNYYDIVIDLQNNFRSGALTRKLHRQTFIFKKNTLKKFLLVKFKINLLKNYPQIPVRYAQTVNVNLDNDGLEIFTDEIADSKLNINEKYVGLCPGAKHFTKRWPKENFIELGKMLESKGYEVVLFGGKSEMDLTAEIAAALSGAVNLCDDNILKTAANMRMCKLIYTNDSGAMHLACAVNVPVIAFFGSTVKEFGFFPYIGQNSVLEISNLPCRPCTHIGRESCPLKHFKCMNDITPELAFSRFKKFQMI